MCLIAVGPLPPKKYLENAANQNDDGIGIAFKDRNAIQYEKDLSVEDLLKLPERIKSWCAVHFRLATVGGVDKTLIHPFPVNREVTLAKKGRADKVLMHNGHVSDWDSMFTGVKIGGKRRFDPKGAMSDSRLLAHMVWRYGDDILYLIRGQRIMLWHKDGPPMLYGTWVQEGATSYSNDCYKREGFQRGWMMGDGFSRRDYYWPPDDDKGKKWETHYMKDYVKDKDGIWRRKPAAMTSESNTRSYVCGSGTGNTVESQVKENIGGQMSLVRRDDLDAKPSTKTTEDAAEFDKELEKELEESIAKWEMEGCIS